MKVLLVRQIFRHHSPKSGYDVTFSNIDSVSFINVYHSDRFKTLKKVVHKLLSMLLPKKFSTHYRFEQFLLERKVGLAIKKHKPNIVHVTYAHDDFKFIKNKPYSKGVRFVGTVHLPYAMWKIGRRKLNWLAMYDKIMVLDHYSKLCFEQTFPDKIVFTPHGVDTNYFKLTKSFEGQPVKKEIFSCLFVGRFMRDIDMVLNIIKLLYQKDKSIQVHFSHPIINNPDQFYYKMIGAISLPTVHYHSKLSDADLLKLYQTADVLITPMFESTANNVLLEAAACGMPPLATFTNGLHTYLPTSLMDVLGNLNTAEEIVDLIIRFKNEPAFYNKVAKEMYDNVMENFTLEKSRDIPLEIYKSLL